MNERPDPLDARLRQALTTRVPAGTRTRHLAALEARLSPRLLGLRRRVVAAAAAAAIAGPTVAAAAAETAMPGDLLYPVKRAAEAVRQLLDGDVAAEHRVEELEALLAERADRAAVAGALDEAAGAVAATDVSPDVLARFAAARTEAARRLDPGDGQDAPVRPTPPPTRGPAPSPTRDTQPSDDRTASRDPSPSPTRDGGTGGGARADTGTTTGRDTETTTDTRTATTTDQDAGTSSDRDTRTTTDGDRTTRDGP